MTSRFLKVFCLTCCMLLFAGCSETVTGSAHGDVNLSSWIVYWDVKNGQKDYDGAKEHLKSLSYFCAHFNENDILVIPSEIQQAKQQRKKTDGMVSYLAIVNDRDLGDGGMVEKDTDVLYRMLGSSEAMDDHIDNIISLAKKGGYDGVEIDYEKLWKDPELFHSYLDFIEKLYNAAYIENLKVRVVLESSTPFDGGFCKGPQYVVMLYNLYGTHSGPGPKANEEFIRKTIARMKALPGEKVAAFSTGGCHWEYKDIFGLIAQKKKFIDTAEAKGLQKKYQAETKRDADSGCLVFKYKDQNRYHTVWYADGETLNHWIAIAEAQGIKNISIWRLGKESDIQALH